MNSVEVIILGGGVMNRSILYPIIRNEFKKLLNGYVEHPLLEGILIQILKNFFINEN